MGNVVRVTLKPSQFLEPDVTILDVSTTVGVPPVEAYEFVLDFDGHADYSDYVDGVTRRGDGDVGTRYDVDLSWWKLEYRFPTVVTGLDRPERIEWRTPNGLAATGAWLFEDADGQGTTDGGSRTADVDARETEVTLRARYDRERSRLPPTPPLVSFDDLLSRLKPVVEREARRVFEYAVADLEGERRPVELDVDVRA